MAPLEPVAPEFAVFIKICPLEVWSLDPVTIDTPPPVKSVESPPNKLTFPPCAC